MGRDLHVGIVGAGIGGVLASIAMARVGCKVTVLEAAKQLGEISASIQMVIYPPFHLHRFAPKLTMPRLPM